jgi:iron-sulfur cluster assembly accessory protein
MAIETRIDPQLITLSDAAADQLRTMIQKKGNAELGLRVWVQPGGCSGFSYGMALDDAPLDDDVISEINGLKVIVDSFSAQHLGGAKVDYLDSLMGAGFTVLNPNAVSSCGCGHSFESAQGGGDAHACGSGGCAH